MIKLENRADGLAAKIDADELTALYREGLKQFREDLGAEPVGGKDWELPPFWKGEPVDYGAAITSGYRAIYRAGILAGIESIQKHEDDLK